MAICTNCGKRFSEFTALVGAEGLCNDCFEAGLKGETPAAKRDEPGARTVTGEAGGVIENPNVNPPIIRDAQLRLLIKRYDDAYTVAKVTVAFGSGVQMAGKAIGVVLAVLAFALASQTRGSEATVFGIVGVVLAAMIGGLVYILGILISAVGQILTASLDAAIHTSPFLAHHQRLKIMSLS